MASIPKLSPVRIEFIKSCLKMARISDVSFGKLAEFLSKAGNKDETVSLLLEHGNIDSSYRIYKIGSTRLTRSMDDNSPKDVVEKAAIPFKRVLAILDQVAVFGTSKDDNIGIGVGDVIAFCYGFTVDFSSRTVRALYYGVECCGYNAYDIAPYSEIFECRESEITYRFFADKFLESINLREYGLSEKKHKYNKSKYETTKATIQYIVEINKARTEGLSSVVCTYVDWSHQWEVAGHWRKYDGVGKNEFGDRTEQGRTWVSPCVKGPDDKPLVVKTRVAK